MKLKRETIIIGLVVKTTYIFFLTITLNTIPFYFMTRLVVQYHTQLNGPRLPRQVDVKKGSGQSNFCMYHVEMAHILNHL